MCSLFTIFLSAILGTVCPLVPRPQHSSAVEETFVLKDGAVISYDAAFRPQAQLLQAELHRYAGVEAVLAESGVHKDLKPQISICPGPKSFEKEEYSIKMGRGGVQLKASDASGAVNAVMAFVQLARLSDRNHGKVEMDCWNIEDRPRYQWRGFMLDEARHFFGKEKVKQLLDWMALYRMNRFHWHLADTQAWRIEILKWPRLANVGGIGNHTEPDAPAKYYTQAEIREIVAYAAERNIEIIPEIDMPGHATAAVRAYPEYDGGGSEKVHSYTFNPGKEGTYAFLSSVLAEVDVLFPSQIIHLGGDEVSYANSDWKTDKDVQQLMQRENLDSLKQVEQYFSRRMADSVYARCNKVAAWDEVVDAGLDKDRTIVYFWRPNRTDMLQKALDAGYPIVFSPRLPMYFDYAQDTLQVHGVDWRRFTANTYVKVYEYECDACDVKYPKHPDILGVQANMWTERVCTDDRLDYMIFPRLAALAETAWTDRDKKNLEDFNRRLELQLELYREDKIYFCNPFNREETGEPMR